MKKVNKNSPALWENSPTPRSFFGGQTAPSPAHCERSVQIICIGKVNQSLKSQTPPYLPNGDSVGKCFYIIGFITLENGGVGRLQIPKKNRNGVKMPIKHKNPKSPISCKLDTFKQKQLYIFGKTSYNSIFLVKTSHNSIFSAKLCIIPYFWQNLAKLHKFGKTKT